MMVRRVVLQENEPFIRGFPVGECGCGWKLVCDFVLLVAQALGHGCNSEPVFRPSAFNVVVSPHIVLRQVFKSETKLIVQFSLILNEEK